MNARYLLTTFTLALVCALAGPTNAAGRCDEPRTMIDQRACQAADQGPDTLRRFVERTRMIYALRYYDFARDNAQVPPRATAAEPSNPRS